MANGLVVVGTFAPTFDPYRYTIEYGDAFQNLLPGAYDMAVADGNFMPIATDLTNDLGAFFGLGSTTAPAGTPLWLFAFEAPLPDSFHQVLATSSNAAWQVPVGAGMTSLAATQLDSFVMGQAHPEGVALTVIPFPEPAACCLAACVAPALAIAARGRRESSAYAE